MTCVLSAKDDTNILTFNIEFKNLEDYRTKVEKIIRAGSNEKLIPNVVYENLNTVFKKGVKFTENFTSFDLLQWYFDAVKEAGIINHEVGIIGVAVCCIPGRSSEYKTINKYIKAVNACDTAKTKDCMGTNEIIDHKFPETSDKIEILKASGLRIQKLLPKDAKKLKTFKVIACHKGDLEKMAEEFLSIQKVSAVLKMVFVDAKDKEQVVTYKEEFTLYKTKDGMKLMP